MYCFLALACTYAIAIMVLLSVQRLASCVGVRYYHGETKLVCLHTHTAIDTCMCLRLRVHMCLDIDLRLRAHHQLRLHLRVQILSEFHFFGCICISLRICISICVLIFMCGIIFMFICI